MHDIVSHGGKAEPLVTVLDKLLHTGVVLDGQLILTVAGVDLVFVGLRALLASIDTASRIIPPPSQPDKSQVV